MLLYISHRLSSLPTGLAASAIADPEPCLTADESWDLFLSYAACYVVPCHAHFCDYHSCCGCIAAPRDRHVCLCCQLAALRCLFVHLTCCMQAIAEQRAMNVKDMNPFKWMLSSASFNRRMCRRNWVLSNGCWGQPPSTCSCAGESQQFKLTAGLSRCQCTDVQEDLITFKRVMDATGDALMRAASAVLAGSAAELGYEGALDDFGQRLCDSMAIFGAAHFHCLSTQEKKTLFLQQVGRWGSVADMHFGNFWSAAAAGVLLAGTAVHNMGSTCTAAWSCCKAATAWAQLNRRCCSPSRPVSP